MSPSSTPPFDFVGYESGDIQCIPKKKCAFKIFRAMVAAKVLGHCGPLWAIQVPLMVVEEAKRKEGKLLRHWAPNRLQPLRLFNIWNLPTNQVLGRNLNIWIEICWKDSQSYLYLWIVECVIQFGWKCFKTYLYFSFLCWCPLAFHQITLSFSHSSFTEKKTFIPFAIKTIFGW